MVTLSNKTYDALKFVSLVLLPGIAAAYFGLSQIWHLPAATEVVGTITIVDTFMGLVIKSSSNQYANSDQGTDGDLLVQQVDGEKFLALGVNQSVEAMTAKDTVTLKVKDQTSSPPE